MTHSITYLAEVDYVIVMKNGMITENGTYEELLSRRGDFADFINNHSVEEEPANLEGKEK